MFAAAATARAVGRASAAAPAATQQVWAQHVLRRWLSGFGKGQPITMPALSPTMNAGKIAKWNVKEGDKLSAGQTIAEVETDKATVDFQFQDDDLYLAKVLVPAGAEDVKVGTPVALVVDDIKHIAEVQAGNYSSASAAAPAAAPAAPAPAAAGSAAPAAAGHASSAADAASLTADKVMPSARSLLASNNIGIGGIKGTGKGGRITKGDVLVAMGKIPASALTAAAAVPVSPSASSAAAPAKPAAASAAAPAAATAADRPGGGTFKDTKPSTVRKVIASRLTESKATIPAQYAAMDCRIDALMKLRAVLKEGGLTVSVNDLVIKAAAKALKAVPEANAQYDPKADRVKANATVDVSVAVATEGGLITPIVRDADLLGVSGIAEKVKDLAGRARANKLKPEEFQGGSFTISNLGMFGIDEFIAVINPPQACILAIGKGEKRVVYPGGGPGDDFSFLPGWVPEPKPKAAAGAEGKGDKKGSGKGEAKEGAAKPAAPAAPAEPTLATVMTVQLSSDARVVEPAVAGQFLQVFRHYIENPTLLVA